MTSITNHHSSFFDRINNAAQPHAEVLLRYWLPDGQRLGSEYLGQTPERIDRRLGVFKVNVYSGRWSDFAIGVRGGDFISLAAYLNDLSQYDAAILVANALGIKH